jgi:hypothetical protein
MRLLREGLKIKHLLLALALILVAAPLAAVVSNRFLESRALDRVERDWNELRMACVNYGLDRCGVYYPPDTAERRMDDPGFPLTFELDKDFITRRPTGNKQEAVTFWFPLTTPVAYASKIPLDPFHPGHFYGYTCWNLHDFYPTLAFFHSPGPDRKADLPMPELRQRIERFFQNRPPSPVIQSQDYGALREILRPYLYDPERREDDSGDLVWILDGAYEPWGFRHYSGLFETAATPELPISEEPIPVAIAEGWEPGRMLPKPRTHQEMMVRERTIPLPEAVAGRLRVAELMDWSGGSPRLPVQKITALMNHLGRDFESFFVHPSPLDAGQLERLKAWEKETPLWWNALAFEQPLVDNSGVMSFPAKDVYVLLPLFGKSYLLLVARDLGEGREELALRRLNQFQDFLEYLKNNSYFEDDPYEGRVMEELQRLSEELAAGIGV